jgi:hypothetical protein
VRTLGDSASLKTTRLLSRGLIERSLGSPDWNGTFVDFGIQGSEKIDTDAEGKGEQVKMWESGGIRMTCSILRANVEPNEYLLAEFLTACRCFSVLGKLAFC